MGNIGSNFVTVTENCLKSYYKRNILLCIILIKRGWWKGREGKVKGRKRKGKGKGQRGRGRGRAMEREGTRKKRKVEGREREGKGKQRKE